MIRHRAILRRNGAPNITTNRLTRREYLRQQQRNKGGVPVPPVVGSWILAMGTWDDAGDWIDSEVWNDN